jgi:hypothetical protein
MLLMRRGIRFRVREKTFINDRNEDALQAKWVAIWMASKR